MAAACIRHELVGITGRREEGGEWDQQFVTVYSMREMEGRGRARKGVKANRACVPRQSGSTQHHKQHTLACDQD